MIIRKKYVYIFIVLVIAILVFGLGASCSLCSNKLAKNSSVASTISNVVSVENTLTEEEKKIAEADKAKAFAVENGTTVLSSDTSSNNSSSAAASNTNSTDTSYVTAATSAETSSGTTAASDSSTSLPVFSLRIYEGPTFSPADSIYYYRVEAVIASGSPATVTFSRDDSHGAWGNKKAQINLSSGTSYILVASSANASGTASTTLTLTAPGTAAAAITPSSSTNHPPSVGDITIAGTSGGSLLSDTNMSVSVAASDPDGNALTYAWSATGGSFTNATVNPVQWHSPSGSGDFTINVTVSDGYGGIVTKTKTVNVMPILLAVPILHNSSMPLVSSEGGFLEANGTTHFGGCYYVGDTNADGACKAFISFDISGLSGTTIDSALLNFGGGAVWGDTSTMGSVGIGSYYWGIGTPSVGTYNAAPLSMVGWGFGSPSFSINDNSLKSALQNAINCGQSRFQLRLDWTHTPVIVNAQWDGWEWQQPEVSLNVNYWT